MNFGQVGYGAVSLLQPNQPSVSIFGDCPGAAAVEDATGYQIATHFEQFTLPPATTGGVVNYPVGPFLVTATSGGTLAAINTTFDHVITSTAGAATNDFIQISTRPLGPITGKSGIKLWGEVSIGEQSVTNADSTFIGFVNAAALPVASTAALGFVSGTHATKGNNTLLGGAALGLAGTSFAGFWRHGDTPANFDAVYGNLCVTAVTPATVNVVLANVLTATSANPNPGNLSPAPLPAVWPVGALTVDTTGAFANPTKGQAATLVTTNGLATNGAGAGSANFLKLGLRFDGQQYLYWYVNGIQIAKLDVTAGSGTGTPSASNASTAFDQTSSYAFTICQAAVSAVSILDLDFVRVAAKIY